MHISHNLPLSDRIFTFFVFLNLNSLFIYILLCVERYEATGGAPVFGGLERNENNSAFVFDVSLASSDRCSHSLLAAAVSDGSARISDFKSNNSKQEVAALQCNGFGALTSVNWSSDGSTLASTCSDGSILLWDTRTWQCRSILRGVHSRSCFGCLFHPIHNDMLLSWSSDGTIGFWDSKSGASENDIPTMPEVFSYDQPLPLASAYPNIVSMSSTESETYPIYRCAMSPKGDQLVVAGGGDGKNSFLGVPIWIYDFPWPVN